MRTGPLIGVALACAVTLGSADARAGVVTGTFAGTITAGTDVSGIFGAGGTDLSGTAIQGSFAYDPSLFSSLLTATTNTAAATGAGALAVTVTIGGVGHSFTDQTSASVYLDTGASEFTIQNANSQSGSGSTVAETFYLDALDPLTPFVGSLGLDQSFAALPLSSSGSFTISDTAPDLVASGAFTLTQLTLTGTGSAIPEPGALTLLGSGLGLLLARRRRPAAWLRSTGHHIASGWVRQV